MNSRHSSRPTGSAATVAAGTALVADHVAVEVATAFAAAGIRSILLKGPSIARRLYDSGEIRGYVDADFLVPPSSRTRAENVLSDLGFAHWAGLGQRSVDRPPWSSTWVRARDSGNVDLHRTIDGARAEAAEVWSVLEGEVEPVEVLGTRLEGLSAEATAVVVALHAAHHGARVLQPLDDLARALDRLPYTTWERASVLVNRLDAVEAYAAGLRLLPAGGQLAARLGLPDEPSTETILRAATPPPMALGFDWLAQTPGLRAKLLLVAGKIVPDPEFMRAWFPLARGGSRIGLALAYLWRPLWLLWHSGPGLRAWLAARRRAHR